MLNSSFLVHRSSFHSSISDDHLLRSLVLARLVTACRLAPGRHRIAASGSLAFAAAMWVVHRVHRHAAYMWANALPTRSASFTERNILVLNITDLAHRRTTLDGNA